MGKGQVLYQEAKSIIPGGTQLLSKRPEMFLPNLWPAYYKRAKGCEVWDLDDNHYYDASLMGVGANVLGYAFSEVDKAAKEAIECGGMCTLNAPEEVSLAKKMIELHPWADMVRYAKTGGEAMAMAARIARAHTGKDVVLVCGYHGWHDWYLAANLVKGDPLAEVHLRGLEPKGVPKGMAGTNFIFHYNDIEEFKKVLCQNRGEIAAVIMEPIRNEFPEKGFLEEIREITQKENIVLIYDEITAGFRVCCGGSHLLLGVMPDIAIFAKAMTNGYPLASVIGREDVMSSAQDTFISSTFWTERVALKATLATIEYFQKHRVEKRLEIIGKKVQMLWEEHAQKAGVNIRVSGIYPLSHFEFTDVQSLEYKTFFTQEMLKRGFLASTGFYISYSHTDEIIAFYEKAFCEVISKIAMIQRSSGDIKEYLDSTVCHEGFERLN